MGAENAPDEYHPDDDPTAPLVLMLPVSAEQGARKIPVEVTVEVHVRRWSPPGWMEAPLFSADDRVGVSGEPVSRVFVVREVLGTDRDPRPGYLIAPITKLDPLDVNDEAARVVVPMAVIARPKDGSL